ncbi:phage antirepressor KilAC domain-containing protein [Paenibacillus sp. EKM202P]|uniref:phage antirepressor KilAC domain-containing protein n=1 Tax=unclassified Paenibacillus TaxID=185978 RepID=UPI0013EC0B9F|nr:MULTISPECIES: phage antirepressor KilAC domain-containing protein [unclassified Paenibacillus]KAF6565409.1 phage antirepressor KilAC domain-containing protein [Paenibacillus sp. EKM202P]KAF6569266.1 phage antirepressor KilAC domain-containing protein [Paenibacillus sp. EKM207P]
MENNIQVVEQKLVEFNGSELLGVKANDGKIYAGVRWVCEGVGLSDGQVKAERKKIKEDIVLNQGGRNFVLPTKGGQQDILTLDIDFLPLWLAKITITPNMQKNQPEVASKLIQYQLKAKDVLAEAFVHKSVQQYPVLPTTYKEALLALVEQVEANEKLHTEKTMLEQVVAENKPKVTYYDTILNAKNTVLIKQIAADYGLTAQELNKILHSEKVQYKQGGQWLLYKDHFHKAYTKSNTFRYKDKDGKEKTKMSTKWTQKGRLFIHSILERLNIRPVMDLKDNGTT